MSEKIEELKKSWLADPCWDIENTEGFEDDFEELKAFRLEKEAEWQARVDADRKEMAEKIGIPGNMALLDYLRKL
jgi:hypothetical protein